MSRKHALAIGAVLLGAAWVAAGVFVLGRGGDAPVAAVGEEYPLCTTKGSTPSGERGGASPDDGGHLELRLALGDPRSSGLGRWPGPIDAVPAVFDFDGDGTKDVVAHSNDTTVYVFNGKTGHAAAQLETKYPPGWYIERILNRPEVGRLEPGGPPAIIVTDHAACVTAWVLDADATTAKSFRFEKAWEVRMNACFWNPGMDAGARLVDLGGGKGHAVLVQTEEVGLFALDAKTGVVRWQQCWAGGNADPVAHDLDGDGDLEAVFASDGGFVAVLDAASGAPQWTFDATSTSLGLTPASISVSPTVAELDGKLPRELVFTARHAPSADKGLFSSFHMGLVAIRQDPETWQSELVWARSPEWAHPLSDTRLVAKDLDGDGRDELFGMDWNTIGHNPGNWESLGPAHLFALDSRGRDLWVQELPTWWSNKDIAVGDSDGDGRLDILAVAPTEFFDGLWRIDAQSGDVLDRIPVPEWNLMRGPTLTDLDGDGQLDLLVPAVPADPDDHRGTILVYDLGVSARGA